MSADAQPGARVAPDRRTSSVCCAVRGCRRFAAVYLSTERVHVSGQVLHADDPVCATCYPKTSARRAVT